MRGAWVVGLAAMLAASLGPASAAGEDGERLPLVALVYGEYSYRDSPQGEGASALRYLDTVRDALDAVGVSYTVLNDAGVETRGLLPYRAAILPYNFLVTPEEEAALARFVSGGGKVIVCYSVSGRVADLIGVRVGERTEGRFHRLRLDPARLPGAPESVLQDSWNVLPIEVAAPDAQVVGEWVDPDGRALGPGLAISPRGAYLGHVLTAGDTANKGRLLLAVLGKLVPEVWQRAAQGAIGSARRKLEEMAARVAARDEPEASRQAEPLLAKARQGLALADQLAATRPAEAVAAAIEAGKLAEEAFLVSAVERRDEFRAVWLHDAYGVADWGWERTIRELKDHGFNAIIPNMLWAGLAHYQSEILPVSPQVAERGDQIAEALRWCRHYGIELHIWKVNHYLATAPEEFVQRLRQEGRLQRNAEGEEELWLCPSDPRNRALERDSMLEVVRKYPVDGIHFDYIRYPHRNSCFCEGCRERFQREAGLTVANWPQDVITGPLAGQYDRWRQDQISALVREVATEARHLRPGIMISAAVFGWPGARQWVHQNWAQWVEEGLLDFVCPMNYTTSAEELETYVAREQQVVAGRIPLYIGTGEFIIPESWQVVDQIERSRRLGADGFVLFSYEHLGPAPGRMADLHRSLLAHPARPPHPAPRVRFTFPAGLEGRERLSYPEDRPATATALLTTGGNYPRPIQSAAGSLAIETADGRPVRRVGALRADGGRPLTVSLDLPPGRYRLAARGTARLEGGESRDFVVRSQVFEVVARATR